MSISRAIRDEVMKYHYELRDMCEQEYIKKQVNGGDVIYTFADESTITLKALGDDL
ncbi:coil containing protein [Vibrio phage 1.174.O._10N.261.55.A8]|nr:coil containing protein [Vibrio phage 1.174.O._10N.261.55.A8]